MGVRQGKPTRGRDLRGDALGGRGIRAFAADRAAEVVDHYCRAARGEQERIGAPDPAAGAGDDGDAALEP